jgi:hypothetical protein
MLEDPRAREIIRRARQPNVADPDRSGSDFSNLFADVFADHDFSGELVIDLGPGQYGFALGVRDRGGVVHNVDRDPAVVELGRYLGFEVIQQDLRALSELGLAGRYDGVFCKFSVNAFWPAEPQGVRAATAAITELAADGAWGLVMPWNGQGKRPDDDPEIPMRLELQMEAFRIAGWSGYELNDALCKRWGVTGRVANHVAFATGLQPLDERVSPLDGCEARPLF